MGVTFAIQKPCQLRKCFLCTVNYTTFTLLWKESVKDFDEWEHCTTCHSQSVTAGGIASTAGGMALFGQTILILIYL